MHEPPYYYLQEKRKKVIKMMINFRSASLIIILALGLLVGTSGAQQCGTQYPNCNCPEGYCCSSHGYCGKTDAYCATGNCQCQCPAPSPPPPPPPPYTPPPPVSPDDVSNIVSKELFEEMLLHRNDNQNCAIGFYTYEGFITAARRFPEFGATGTLEDRKREIAAFFGQTSHETTGAGTGWVNPPDGPYTWGYCFVREEGTPAGYCVPSTEWPCVPGQDYYGRGPIQISYNYNYGLAGAALGFDLLHNPDLVATNVVLSFETALWFWVTVQAPKPSCHDVITGQWTPSQADKDANRLPGYGLLTNIINGGRECGNTGPDGKLQEDRIGFYLRYCHLLGVSPGDNLDCYNQRSYGVTLRNPKYGILKMPVDKA